MFHSIRAIAATGYDVPMRIAIRRRIDSERVVGSAAAWTVITPGSSDNAVSFKSIPPLAASKERFGRMAARQK
jgi:hypothetical protein